MEIIQERQRAEKVQRDDVFGNLLEANNDTFDVNTLTKE